MKHSLLALKFAHYFDAVERGYKKSMMYYWLVYNAPAEIILAVCFFIIVESKNEPSLPLMLGSYVGLIVLACWTAFWYGVSRAAGNGEVQRSRTDRLLRQIENEVWAEEMRQKGILPASMIPRDGDNNSPII